jgi:hypothetical protein
VKETRLIVSLTRDEVVEKIKNIFSDESWRNTDFITQDRQFGHICTKRTVSDVLFRNNDFDPLFIDLHFKELGESTQVIITPTTNGYLLALKIFFLPSLWIIAPVLAIHQEGWRIVPKLLIALISIQLLLWIMNKFYKRQTQKIVNVLIENLSPFKI